MLEQRKRIGALYFFLGFLNKFVLFTIRLDYKHYGLHISEINNKLALLFSPWAFKVLYGILIDRVPLCGYRRVSYMLS